MLIVVLTCLALIALTSVFHYEVLRLLNLWLPQLNIPNRPKLLVVVIVTFAAHAVEIVVYGLALFALVEHLGVGGLDAPHHAPLVASLYLSAETYTSLGFGDIRPLGPVRMLAGVEALNGLLLIGWSASYLYIAMEKFWRGAETRHRH
jgi:Ion channel